MGHGEAVEDSFLSLVDAMAHGKNKIVYFSGLFWDSVRLPPFESISEASIYNIVSFSLVL